VTLRAARALFFVLGAAFLALAFVRTWDEAQGRVLPSAASLAAGGVTVLIAVVCGALGWTALFERADLRRPLLQSFVVSQLGKYIPGGVWQYVGQVSFATDAGAPPARTALVLPVHIVVQVAAAGSLGALAGILVPSAPLAWRAAALAGAGALALLNRGPLLAATRAISRLGMRRAIDDDLPSQTAIYRSYLWTVAVLLASGSGFALMLASVVPAAPLAPAVAVFAFAWLCGFLAVFVPAGFGVREAVLIALLPASAGAIVAVSICHRLLTIAVEWALLMAARVYAR
jgi:hypothetical protein